MKIIDSQDRLIAEHNLAGDWRLTFNAATHAVLHIPVVIGTVGQLMEIGELIPETDTKTKPISIQIAGYRFDGFTIEKIEFTSILDESVPDHVAAIEAVSIKNPTRKDIRRWFS